MWDQLLNYPILNLLIALYRGLSVVGLPGAFGWAIILLTVIIRFLLYPLTHTQLKSAQKMQELKPKLDELSSRFKNDKTKLQQAQLELYKTAGVNPAAGCLPLLLQIPVFIALYNVFIKIFNGQDSLAIEQINKVLYHPLLFIDKIDLNFFVVNLASKPNEWAKLGLGLLLVPVITGGLQYWQTKLMTPAVKKEIDNTKKPTDQMGDIQRQMAVMMPIMFGFFAYSLPIGLSLYWNTMTVFGIIQQLNVNKNKPR